MTPEQRAVRAAEREAAYQATAAEWRAEQLAKVGPLTQEQQAILRRVLLRRSA